MLARLEAEIKAGTRLDRICFVTATVAARDEARKRAQRLLPSATDRDFRYFRTIHGICFGELHLGRDNVMQTDDYLDFGRKACILFSEAFTEELDDDGLPQGFAHSAGNEILAVRQFAAACLADINSPDVIRRCPPDIPVSEFRAVIQKFEEYKRKHTKFDFVDMLLLYLGSEFRPLDIDTIFIDEAQDLSKLQWRVVDKFAAEALRRYVAGDDDQSIYGFIGADPLGFYSLPAEETVILPRTYRLKRNIWDFARRIIEEVRDRVPKQIEVVGEGGTVGYWNLDPEYLDYDGEQVMLIARHHSQLASIARSLEKRGTPFLHRGYSLTGTERSKAVFWFLELKSGQKVRVKDAARIVKLAARNHYKNFAEVARTRPDELIGSDGLAQYGVDLQKPWQAQFGTARRDHNQNEGIASILRENHRTALINAPRVELTTYHASKGREAKRVVLFTNCYQAAWDNAQLYPDQERRLAYVGATRAMDDLTIVAPTSGLYMRSLI